jgi:hypothetical protein
MRNGDRALLGKWKEQHMWFDLEIVKLTSPFSSLKSNRTLSPCTSLSVTSEATHPSVGSVCQARVPTSYDSDMMGYFVGGNGEV